MINDMFIALNSFDISTFNQFYFFKVTGYYSIQRFPATLNVTHDAVLNSRCLKPQQKDLTAQHSPYTLHHRSFNMLLLALGIFWEGISVKTPPALIRGITPKEDLADVYRWKTNSAQKALH